jgi:hypothetical protein
MCCWQPCWGSEGSNLLKPLFPGRGGLACWHLAVRRWQGTSWVCRKHVIFVCLLIPSARCGCIIQDCGCYGGGCSGSERGGVEATVREHGVHAPPQQPQCAPKKAGQWAAVAGGHRFACTYGLNSDGDGDGDWPRAIRRASAFYLVPQYQVRLLIHSRGAAGFRVATRCRCAVCASALNCWKIFAMQDEFHSTAQARAWADGDFRCGPRPWPRRSGPLGPLEPGARSQRGAGGGCARALAVYKPPPPPKKQWPILKLVHKVQRIADRRSSIKRAKRGD